MRYADYRAELDAFIADLKRVKRAAGGPSYGQLAYLSARMLDQRRSGDVRFVPLPPSTTSEILSGRRQALKWPWVLTFLTALQEAARQGGIDAAEVGAIDEWKRRYEALLAAQEAQLRPGRPIVQRQKGARGGIGVIDRAVAVGPASVRDDDSKVDALMGAFLAVVRRAGVPPGRHGGRAVAPEGPELYLTLESLAEVIRTYETAVVPGLLQTEAYAHAVTALRLPDATTDKITRLVDQSMQRQALCDHQRSCRLWAVVEEAAFFSRQVDAQVMRAQIKHLIDLAHEPGVTLQIVRGGTAGNLTLSEPMTIFRFPEPYLGDVVCAEQPERALFLHERKDTDHYNQLFGSLTTVASRPETAKKLLRVISSEI
jgi:Domain of unknown function (DUF5753)